MDNYSLLENATNKKKLSPQSQKLYNEIYNLTSDITQEIVASCYIELQGYLLFVKENAIDDVDDIICRKNVNTASNKLSNSLKKSIEYRTNSKFTFLEYSKGKKDLTRNTRVLEQKVLKLENKCSKSKDKEELKVVKLGKKLLELALLNINQPEENLKTILEGFPLKIS